MGPGPHRPGARSWRRTGPAAEAADDDDAEIEPAVPRPSLLEKGTAVLPYHHDRRHEQDAEAERDDEEALSRWPGVRVDRPLKGVPDQELQHLLRQPAGSEPNHASERGEQAPDRL